MYLDNSLCLYKPLLIAELLNVKCFLLVQSGNLLKWIKALHQGLEIVIIFDDSKHEYRLYQNLDKLDYQAIVLALSGYLCQDKYHQWFA